MRLIDVDEPMNQMQSFHCNNCDRRKGTKNGKLTFVYEIGDVPCRACGIGDAIEYLEDAPTVDAVPVVHGRWSITTERFTPELVCSACGGKVPCISDMNVMPELQYCPHCGAKMDKEDNDGQG